MTAARGQHIGLEISAKFAGLTKVAIATLAFSMAGATQESLVLAGNSQLRFSSNSVAVE